RKWCPRGEGWPGRERSRRAGPRGQRGVSRTLLLASLSVEKSKPSLAAPGPLAGPCCPDGWIGYQGKCYYFSETEGNWTYSQSQCSALNASLAGIDSEPMDSLPSAPNGPGEKVGARGEHQAKLSSGQVVPNIYQHKDSSGSPRGGDCAFLMDEGWLGSSRCSTGRRWICSKPDACTMGKDVFLFPP
uniref:C-type lectin domain-containing protein n=1 Tax=Chelonoidis abingdonii TaxID=106734 RepID=A0A8C0J1X1_CHEAB